MNDLQVFKNAELGLQVRTIQNYDGSISINAEDTAIGFGWYKKEKKNGREYTSIRWATLNGYCKEFGFDNKLSKDDYIPESLFYRLGMKANNVVADKFQNWLSIEVIPSIRKHGGYIMNQESMTPEQIMAEGILIAQRIIESKNKEIERMKPKEVFADAVKTSHTSILVGDLAKILKQNGIETGPKRLFEWLRNNGYLIKRNGTDRNMPTQKAMEMGLFEVKESIVNNPDGSVRITKTTKVTGKGQLYFINKFLDERSNSDD